LRNWGIGEPRSRGLLEILRTTILADSQISHGSDHTVTLCGEIGPGTSNASWESMTPQELRARTKRFAIDIVKIARSVPREWYVRVIGGQLLRAGTAVAANYRVCCRARSDREFCAKMGVVVEESDESQLWLELLAVAHSRMNTSEYRRVMKEAAELTAIFTASHSTAKANLQRRARERVRKRSQNAQGSSS